MDVRVVVHLPQLLTDEEPVRSKRWRHDWRRMRCFALHREKSLTLLRRDLKPGGEHVELSLGLQLDFLGCIALL